MRRSFGSGMGSGRGGGGGGGMIKTVHRAIRAGIAGGGSPEPPYTHSTATTTTRTTTNHLQPINTALSLSSNNLNHPVPSATPPNWPSPTTSEEESDWECIDDSESSVINVFGSVPSEDEVRHAVSSLQEVLDEYGIDDKEKIVSCPTKRRSYFHKSGSDQLDWTEPSLELCTSMQVPSSSRVYDAFHLMQTEPSVQRMVISLSSDKAVWDAVMKNEVVRELRESIGEEKSISEEDDVDGGNPVKQVLRWMFVNTRDKVVEIVERITGIVNELVQQQPSKEVEKPKGSTASAHSSFQDKLRSSFLLSIMVLLVVVVTRGIRKA